jgi:hypothetical protein
MYIFQANLVTNLANAAIVGACALSVGFMLRFLHALTGERKPSLVGYWWEYGISNPLPDAANRNYVTQVRSTLLLRASELRGARGRSRTLVTQAPKESMLSHEYRPTEGPRQEPNRA